MKNKFISVIISGQHINEISTLNVSNLLQKLNEKYSDYELIIINNILNKNISVIDNLLKNESCIRVIDIINNDINDYNNQNLEIGFKLSIGDTIVSFNPNETKSTSIIEALIEFENCKQPSKYLVGIYSKYQSLKFWLRSFFYSIILKLISIQLNSKSSDLRIISRNHANIVLTATTSRNNFLIRLAQVGYEPLYFSLLEPFRYKKSTYQLFIKGLKLLIYNSTMPLRLMTTIAILSSVISLFISIYALLVKVLSNSVISGWTSLMLVISLFFCALFLILSFISEYLTNILSHNILSKFPLLNERTSNIIVNKERINICNETNDD